MNYEQRTMNKRRRDAFFNFKVQGTWFIVHRNWTALRRRDCDILGILQSPYPANSEEMRPNEEGIDQRGERLDSKKDFYVVHGSRFLVHGNWDGLMKKGLRQSCGDFTGQYCCYVRNLDLMKKGFVKR